LFGYKDTIACLLKNNANVNIKNFKGKTPRQMGEHAAAILSDQEINLIKATYAASVEEYLLIYQRLRTSVKLGVANSVLPLRNSLSLPSLPPLPSLPRQKPTP
jgi:hypothetical protein